MRLQFSFILFSTLMLHSVQAESVTAFCSSQSSATLSQLWEKAVSAAYSESWKGVNDESLHNLAKLLECKHHLSPDEVKMVEGGVGMLWQRAISHSKIVVDKELEEDIEKKWSSLIPTNGTPNNSEMIHETLREFNHILENKVNMISLNFKSKLTSAVGALSQLSTSSFQPISFSIPTYKWTKYRILRNLINKTSDFSPLIPGIRQTYVYDKEESYYIQYAKSYYAITLKKSGWDCLRHYEILLSGCIPYFLDMEYLPSQTMVDWPRDLISKAMKLPGLPPQDHVAKCIKNYNNHENKQIDHTTLAVQEQCFSIDHELFSVAAYEQIREELMSYVENRLLSYRIIDAMKLEFNKQMKDGLDSMNNMNVLVHCRVEREDGAFINDFLRDLVVIGLVEKGFNVFTTFDSSYLIEDRWTRHELEKRMFGQGYTIGGALPKHLAHKLHQVNLQQIINELSMEHNEGVNMDSSDNEEVCALSNDTCLRLNDGPQVPPQAISEQQRFRYKDMFYIGTTKSNEALPALKLHTLFPPNRVALIDGNDINAKHGREAGFEDAASVLEVKQFRREALPLRVFDF